MNDQEEVSILEPEKLFLIQITVDGKVVAEAPLRIYDPEKAMAAFMDAFPGLIPQLPGMVFAGLRMAATNPSARGAVIAIVQNRNAPNLVVPNGMPPEPNRMQRRHGY